MEAGLGGFQTDFARMEVGLADKLKHIKEAISSTSASLASIRITSPHPNDPTNQTNTTQTQNTQTTSHLPINQSALESSQTQVDGAR